MIKRNFPAPFDYVRIMKFLIVSIIVFTFTYYVTETYLNYTDNLYHFIPNLFLLVIFGVGIYLLITCVIDSKLRALIKSIICEIKNKINS